jgi:hypothetical protein
MMPTAADIPYPVNLSDFIPGLDHRDAIDLLREEADIIQGHARRRTHQAGSLMDAEKEAAARMIYWYGEATNLEPIIRDIGIIRFVASRRRACAVVTLLAFKARGVSDLPL